MLFCTLYTDDSIKGKSKGAFAGMMKSGMKWMGGVPQANEEITPTHAFCVPLERCVPSVNNEVSNQMIFITHECIHEVALIALTAHIFWSHKNPKKDLWNPQYAN